MWPTMTPDEIIGLSDWLEQEKMLPITVMGDGKLRLIYDRTENAFKITHGTEKIGGYYSTIQDAVYRFEYEARKKKWEASVL